MQAKAIEPYSAPSSSPLSAPPTSRPTRPSSSRTRRWRSPAPSPASSASPSPSTSTTRDPPLELGEDVHRFGVVPEQREDGTPPVSSGNLQQFPIHSHTASGFNSGFDGFRFVGFELFLFEIRTCYDCLFEMNFVTPTPCLSNSVWKSIAVDHVYYYSLYSSYMTSLRWSLEIHSWSS